MKFPIIILLVLALSACATTQQKIDYYAASNARVGKIINSSYRITSLVKDNRPYVLNGEKKSSFLGLSRVYGAPVSTYAPSDQPLSSIFAGQVNSVLYGISQKSHFATQVRPSSTFESFGKKMPNVERLITFELIEWKYDANPGWGSTSFIYNVNISVLDANLNEMATSKMKGRTVVKNNQFGDNYARLIEDLVSEPRIVTALNR